MRIRFSDHAKHQIKDRKLLRTAVQSAVRRPDKVAEQSDGRLRAIKKIQWSGKSYALVVVYEIDGNDVVIVTVFRTSKLKKYL